MGCSAFILKLRPSLHRLCEKKFLRFNVRHECTSTGIFSTTGIWEPELSVDVLKRIETYWKGKINNDQPAAKPNPSEKYYVLSMFPYPSGKLHLGHARVYTLGDAFARFYRMKGKLVIHPIGWDAFGLPAENAAIESGVQPAEWTRSNIVAMKEQLLELGFKFDWDREYATCDPDYYRWTQFLFLQLFHHGYAYRRKSVVNWDPVDQTVLADEQVDDNGLSWRSGAKVEKKFLRQWFIRTTVFSQDLYDNLKDPCLKNWKYVVRLQENWIGKPDGYRMDLNVIRDGNYVDTIPVWLDRPELLHGVSFIAVSSDHFLVKDHQGSGKKLSVHAVHPLTEELVPIFIEDVESIATSMNSHVGIPCVNEADMEFAEKNKLKFLVVIHQNPDGTEVLCNSGEFSGLGNAEARRQIRKKIQDSGLMCYPASKSLRDWLISRQRYWGTPIPIVHCKKCGEVPVPFQQLPVILPKVTVFDKRGTSPLATATDWVNTLCPKCGGNAERETDTMDTFVDSSWYYLRYLDPRNEKLPCDPIKAADFMPVDLYIGGVEHAIMHLYYARFMARFCHSLGYTRGPEPFSKLITQGFITAESFKLKNSGTYVKREEVDFSGKTPVCKRTGDSVVVQWEKMSKSTYNGIEPRDVVREYGVDLLRLCMLAYYSPPTQRKWNENELASLLKWQKKIWQTVKEFRQRKENAHKKDEQISDEERAEHTNRLSQNRNSVVQQVSYNMEETTDLRAVVTHLESATKKLRHTPKCMWADCKQFETMLGNLIIMLAPITPHFASELWAGFTNVAGVNPYFDVKLPVLAQKWPELDSEYVLDFIISMNGKDVAVKKITFAELKLLSDELALEKALQEIQSISRESLKDFSYTYEPYLKGKIDLIIADDTAGIELQCSALPLHMA